LTNLPCCGYKLWFFFGLVVTRIEPPEAVLRFMVGFPLGERSGVCADFGNVCLALSPDGRDFTLRDLGPRLLGRSLLCFLFFRLPKILNFLSGFRNRLSRFD
jgi:hypothetical protein